MPADVREQAWQALAQADDVVVPDLFFPEYGNVVWQWARRLDVGAADFLGALDHAEALIERVLPTEHTWRAAVGLLCATITPRTTRSTWPRPSGSAPGS